MIIKLAAPNENMKPTTHNPATVFSRLIFPLLGLFNSLLWFLFILIYLMSLSVCLAASCSLTNSKKQQQKQGMSALCGQLVRHQGSSSSSSSVVLLIISCISFFHKTNKDVNNFLFILFKDI